MSETVPLSFTASIALSLGTDTVKTLDTLLGNEYKELLLLELYVFQ